MRENQGFLDGLDADKTKHSAGYYGGLLVVVGLGKTAAKMVVGMKHEERKLCHAAPGRTSAPPHPPVTKPLGDLVLVGIPGITQGDVGCLSAVGIRTLGELERRCEALPAEDRPATVEGQIYEVIRQYKGAFSPADCERITAAVVAHLKLAKPEAAAGSPAVSTITTLAPRHVETLAMYGLKTMADLAAACEKVRVAKRLPASIEPKIDSNIYSHLRDSFGDHPKLVKLVNEIGDAIMDFLGHEAAREIQEKTPAPAKGKRRKAVAK